MKKTSWILAMQSIFRENKLNISSQIALISILKIVDFIFTILDIGILITKMADKLYIEIIKLGLCDTISLE